MISVLIHLGNDGARWPLKCLVDASQVEEPRARTAAHGFDRRPVTEDNCATVWTSWLQAPTASLLHQCALRGRSSREIQEASRRDVRNECLHLGADAIGLESACEESAACLGRAFSDCKAAAAAEDLGPLGHVSTGEQDELLGVRRRFRDFSCQFPGAQHCTWCIVSDRSLLPNISICK